MPNTSPEQDDGNTTDKSVQNRKATQLSANSILKLIEEIYYFFIAFHFDFLALQSLGDGGGVGECGGSSILHYLPCRGAGIRTRSHLFPKEAC